MIKQLYKIKPSSTQKIIGPTYPQTEYCDLQINDGLNILSLNKGIRLDNLPEIFNVKMSKKAKLIDVISCSLGSGGDFIVSEKFVHVVDKFKCSTIQFFSMKLLFEKEVLENYYWCHFVYEQEQGINFSNSSYDENQLPAINKNKPTDFSEYRKLVEAHKKYNQFRLIKTILRKEFSFDDFFVLGYPNQNKYVSESLMEAIIEAGITGLDIEKAINIKFK